MGNRPPPREGNIPTRVCLSVHRAGGKNKIILVSIGKFSTGQPQLIQALLIRRNDSFKVFVQLFQRPLRNNELMEV